MAFESEDITTAIMLGRDTFEKGLPCLPAADNDLMQLILKAPENSERFTTLIRAFTIGYNNAKKLRNLI